VTVRLSQFRLPYFAFSSSYDGHICHERAPAILLLFLDQFGGAIALTSLSNGIGVPRSLAQQGSPFFVQPLFELSRLHFFFTPRKRGISPTMPLSLC
jgi:hypothetical protein